jgi:hypothetical protein
VVSDCDDTDDDGDGFSDALEGALGTDPLAGCSLLAGAHHAWPPDFDDSRAVNIGDVLAFKPVFGTGSPPARYDLAPGNGVNVQDVLALKPHFGRSCTP